MTITTTITALPTAPSRTDEPDTFATKADAWVGAMDDLTTEINSWGSEANTLATQITTEQVGFTATSTTSDTIATGSTTLTVDTGKNFVVGQTVTIARTSAPTNYMVGVVTAYNSGNGSLTVDVDFINGSGTFTDWTVSLAAPDALPSTTGNGGKVVYVNSGGTGFEYAAPTVGAYGSAPNEITSTTTLTSASDPYIVITSATSADFVLKLPDATTMSEGAGTYVIENQSEYFIYLQDTNSGSIAKLTPRRVYVVNLSDNSTASGNWIIASDTGIEPDKVSIRDTISNTSGGTNTCATRQGAAAPDGYVTAARDTTSLWCRFVGAENGNDHQLEGTDTHSLSEAVDSLLYQAKFSQFGTTQYVFATYFEFTPNFDTQWINLSYTGGTLSAADSGSLINGGENIGCTHALDPNDDTAGLIFYADSGGEHCKTISRSTGTITLGTDHTTLASDLVPYTMDDMQLGCVDTDKYILCYRGASNFWIAKVITNSSGTLSAGTAYNTSNATVWSNIAQHPFIRISGNRCISVSSASTIYVFGYSGTTVSYSTISYGTKSFDLRGSIKITRDLNDDTFLKLQVRRDNSIEWVLWRLTSSNTVDIINSGELSIEIYQMDAASFNPQLDPPGLIDDYVVGFRIFEPTGTYQTFYTVEIHR